MEAVEREPLRVAELRIDPPGVAAWLVSAGLVLYLALSNGGYDIVERSEVGIAVWWMVLVGSAVGALPVAGGTRTGRLMFGLLAAFAAWNVLALGWTESAERTSTEVGRVATYLGVFALALAAQAQGRWRYVLGGITAGMIAVCALAVLSRLEPTWFPERMTEQFLPGIEIDRRLAYPLNYSSGLGAFAAIAAPLALAATASARHIAIQALAAGALPLIALTLWLTTSSLSLPAAAIALLAFFVLAPDRLPKLATLVVSAAGSALLFAAVEQREALDRGLPTPAALAEGDEMKAVILVVCVGVALVQVAISLAARYATRPAFLRPNRAQTALATGVTVAALGTVALAAGGLGAAADGWDRFKDRSGAIPAESSRGQQILDVSSSGRYDFWLSSVDAWETEKLTGIGPGTFEFWWSREGTYPGFVRDAHSLYFESLAELGIVGAALILGFVVAILFVGAARTLRAPPDLRTAIAAATAGCAAFAAAALVDWVWELAVIPVIFLTLAAVAIGAGREPARRRAARRPSGPPALDFARANAGRIGIGALALAAIAAIAVPFARTTSVEASQQAYANGDVEAALEHASDALAFQGGSSSPYIQRALVLEAAGSSDEAVKAVRQATANEPTNWRTWFVRSGVEARAGNPQQSADALRRARRLNGSGSLNSVIPLITEATP
jgi:hypothetical protein